MLFLLVPALGPAASTAAAPGLQRATLVQQGVYADLTIRIAAPSVPNGLYLCARQLSSSGTPLKDICIRPKGRAGTLRVARLTAAGDTQSQRTIHADVSQRKGGYAAHFLMLDAGISTGTFHWQARLSGPASACGATDCATLPASGTFKTLFKHVVGCKAHGASLRTHGSGNRVALTFDDGPSSYTPAFLKVLERARVPATFFMIGRQVAGHSAMLKNELANGYALGNHSWSHQALPSAGDLSATNAAIKKASGYRPCVFRPPYGAINGSVIGGARALGMLTVNWDVDPQDWATPGAGAIQARILGQAHAGSIILMHDGGGPRGQTLAALPRVIAGLKARGYEFVTLPDMFGLAPRYG